MRLTSLEVFSDRSVDPFESLAPTLRYLQLCGIPLYPSIIRLRSLTEFTYVGLGSDFHLDTLLDFLEENRSLEQVALGIVFREDSLRLSRRRTLIKNQFRHLTIFCWDGMDGRALLHAVALQRGAQLDITSYVGAKLHSLLSGLSPTHLLNLHSPTFMEYRPHERFIQLSGPNGYFSFSHPKNPSASGPFEEFPLFPLANIQEFHLVHRKPKGTPRIALRALVFDQSPFPALETLAVDCETSVSNLLSALFSNPSFPPLLKTIAFLNCRLNEEFMEALALYAYKRKETTSAPLRKVVIIDADGVFPGIAAIRRLAKNVPIVDVRVGEELPSDLT